MAKIHAFNFIGSDEEADTLQKFAEENADYMAQVLARLTKVLGGGRTPTADAMEYAIVLMSVALAEAYSSGAMENRRREVENDVKQ